MKITAKQKKRVSSKIVEYLVSRESATRTEVIEGAIRLMGLKPTEMCNLNPKSKYCLLKSYAGTALNDLVIKKVILQNGDKYSLVREEFIVVSQELIQAEIESLLEKGSYSKEEIYIHLEKFFGTDATASSRDDYSLRSIAGNVLFELTDSAQAEIIKGKYTKKSTGVEKTDTPLPEKSLSLNFSKLFGSRAVAFLSPLLPIFWKNIIPLQAKW